MAMKLSNQAADAMLSAIGTLCNGGKLIIYSGTEPATANTALSGNTVLAQLTLNATAFGAPDASGADRFITANAITADSDADASGTATFFRIFDSSGTLVTDVVYQGTAGTSGQQLNLNNTSIIAGYEVSISSLTITMPTE